MDRKRLGTILCIIAVIILTLYGIYRINQDMQAQTVYAPVDVVPTVAASATPEPVIKVHMAGEVENPGVYVLPKGSRVEDAVAAAGGLTANASETSVNLAAVVHDGQQVIVGSGGGGGASANASVLEQGGKINLNIASKEELMLLPGIGDTLAGGIIQYREANDGFRSIEEITNVPKIGEKTFQNIQGWITVE